MKNQRALNAKSARQKRDASAKIARNFALKINISFIFNCLYKSKNIARKVAESLAAPPPGVYCGRYRRTPMRERFQQSEFTLLMVTPPWLAVEWMKRPLPM